MTAEKNKGKKKGDKDKEEDVAVAKPEVVGGDFDLDGIHNDGVQVDPDEKKRILASLGIDEKQYDKVKKTKGTTTAIGYANLSDMYRKNVRAAKGKRKREQDNKAEDDKEKSMDDSVTKKKKKKMIRQAAAEKKEQASEVQETEEACNQRMYLLGLQESKKLAAAGLAHTSVNEELNAATCHFMKLFNERDADAEEQWGKAEIPLKSAEDSDDEAEGSSRVVKALVDIPLVKKVEPLRLSFPGIVSQRSSGKKSALLTGHVAQGSKQTEVVKYFLLPARDAFGPSSIAWELPSAAKEDNPAFNVEYIDTTVKVSGTRGSNVPKEELSQDDALTDTDGAKLPEYTFEESKTITFKVPCLVQRRNIAEGDVIQRLHDKSLDHVHR